MRYFTFGDYFINNHTLNFQIVDHGNDIFTKLTLIHEMVEYFLVEQRGLSIDDIDKFDIDFENDPERVKLYGEPGNDPNCPYKPEHEIAEKVAQMMCEHLGINYNDYENCM